MGGAVSAGEDNEELVDNLVEGDYVRSPRTELVLRAVDRGWFVAPLPEDTPPPEEAHHSPPHSPEPAKASAEAPDEAPAPQAPEGAPDAEEPVAERRRSMLLAAAAGRARSHPAYKDMAWREGLLHVSAPCIYSQALEALRAGPGMAVLNLGSGTGYLSTLLGLLVGPSGASHGVELHRAPIDYAEERQAFLRRLGPDSPFLHFPYTPPLFVQGNALALARPWLSAGQLCGPYDRLYCGAGVPDPADEAREQEEGQRSQTDTLTFLLSFLKVGGVAVVPVGDQLKCFTVTGPGVWQSESLMSVSFATLAPLRAAEEPASVSLPAFQPRQLQVSCRDVVHHALRHHLQDSVGSAQLLGKKTRKAGGEESEEGESEEEGEEGTEAGTSGEGRRATKRRRRMRRMMVPFLEVALRRRQAERRAAGETAAAPPSPPPPQEDFFGAFVRTALHASRSGPDLSSSSDSSSDDEALRVRPHQRSSAPSGAPAAECPAPQGGSGRGDSTEGQVMVDDSPASSSSGPAAEGAAGEAGETDASEGSLSVDSGEEEGERRVPRPECSASGRREAERRAEAAEVRRAAMRDYYDAFTRAIDGLPLAPALRKYLHIP